VSKYRPEFEGENEKKMGKLLLISTKIPEARI
jgi:hypothetical protein